jgi:DNA (cytosine-5)-methyltransferase 1
MSEVRALPKNGFKVVSTFSGCGGSCLGFEMAGFSVLWASEFVKAAQATYRANHPDVFLDVRDVRLVKPEEILAKTGLARGEVDVVEGSPPCASFSAAGNLVQDWGKVRAYSDTKQRVDDLFFEFVRLVDGLRPKVFVAENVSGLVSGVSKGVFKQILREMRHVGYDVEARLLDAQWCGVPQVRRRIIFVGVRDDLVLRPAFPRPLPFRYSLRDALRDVEPSEEDREWLSFARYAIGREWDKLQPGRSSQKFFNLVKPALAKPCPTICCEGGHNRGTATVTHPVEKRKLSIDELKRICSFPADFVLTGDYGRQWERLGRAVPPLMMKRLAETIRDEILVPLRDGKKRRTK